LILVLTFAAHNGGGTSIVPKMKARPNGIGCVGLMRRHA